MNKRLFVGGLPYTTTDANLNELFSKYGTVVSATVIMDKFSGRSKGFGFVEMTTDEEVVEAIKNLNNTDLEGRKIVVNEAKPREERPQNDSRRFDSRGGNRNDRSFGGRSTRRPAGKRW